MDDRIRNYEQGVAEIETLTSMRSNLEVSATEYTPDESQPARDRVFTFAQEEEILSILGDINTGVKNFVDKTNTNTENIAENTADIATNTQAIATNASNIATNASNIATNTANIATNTADIAANASNIATNTQNISTNTENIANNATDIEVADKRISNIEKLLQGNLYDYQTDSTSAYTKTVPAGAMPYAGIERIGGKTLVFNQLATFTAGTVTDNGITWTKNADGTITASGTATANSFMNVSAFLSGKTGHKMLIRGCQSGGSTATYFIYDGYSTSVESGDVGSGKIYTVNTPTAICRCYIKVGTVISTPITFTPQYVDLTLLYGSGNEPSTVEQFREMFPADYYEYNAGTLLSAGAESVKSRGENLADGVGINTGSINSNTGASNSVSGFCRSNYVIVQPNTQYYIKSMGNGVNRVFEYTADSYIGYTNSDDFVDGVYFTTSPTTYRLRFNFFADEPSEITDWVVEKHINSYPIPTPIQQLYGYGWSAGTAYNYIDFERKVFVKNVERIDIGTASVDVITAPDFDIGYVFCITVSGKKTGSRNFIASKYETSTVNGYSSVVSRYGASANRLMYTTGSVAKIYVIDGDYADANSFKTGMNGQYIFYGLATPQEIDISEYLTDDNLISVESGGTLTFPNSNGDNYRIPVPSEETYMINLQEAVSNG